MANSTPIVLPLEEDLKGAYRSIRRVLPDGELDIQDSRYHIDELKAGMNRCSQSSRYYGFVTGGATEISAYADNVVTELDQNVQVHLPAETIATDVEDAALHMLCQLFDLNSSDWEHRTFTTGATASNILGIALAREHVVAQAGERAQDVSKMQGNGKGPFSIAEVGLLKATRSAGIEDIQILTTVPHSSIKKAASVLGLGHDSVIDVSRRLPNIKHLFNFEALETALKVASTASIIIVSCSEVNTGLFATEGQRDFERLRKLADDYGAWIHVDAAIGLLARVLRKGQHPGYERILDGVAGLELVDSIAGDAHKLLNVPYDCGIFLSKHLKVAQRVFENPGASYLTGDGGSDVPSPLNIGIENSRRFRALPVYANLILYGLEGYQKILKKQVELARGVARYIQQHPKFELLPASDEVEKQLANTFMIVCFRHKDGISNKKLAQEIKKTKKIYASGTTWDGQPAVRLAAEQFKMIQSAVESLYGIAPKLSPQKKALSRILQVACG